MTLHPALAIAGIGVLTTLAAACGGSSAPTPVLSSTTPALTPASSNPTPPVAALPAGLTAGEVFGYPFPPGSPKAPGGVTLLFVDGGHVIFRQQIQGQGGSQSDQLSVAGRQMTFSTGSGPYCAPGSVGVYTVTVTARTITFSPHRETCPDRRQMLTAGALRRQH
jgi:hypothetical protein